MRNEPFLISASAMSLSRYFLDFSTRSSAGSENLRRAFEGGGIGSLGWMARERIAAAVRWSRGENESSMGMVSMEFLFLVSWNLEFENVSKASPIIVRIDHFHAIHVAVHSLLQVIAGKVPMLCHDLSRDCDDSV